MNFEEELILTENKVIKEE